LQERIGRFWCYGPESLYNTVQSLSKTQLLRKSWRKTIAPKFGFRNLHV